MKLILYNFELDSENEKALKGLKIGVKILDAISSVFKKVDEVMNLDPVRKATVDKYLKNKKVVIYIDDMDRAWEATKTNIKTISAL